MDGSKYNRYDVYLARLPKGKGSVQQGIRPVIIYNITEYDFMYEKDRLVLECNCLTSSETKAKLPVHFTITPERSCLPEKSTFLAEQVFTLYESDLIRKMGVITDMEYRYEIYRTRSIQLNRDRPIFKYPYDFLMRVRRVGEFLCSAWWLCKNEDTEEELKVLLRQEIDLQLEDVRSICREFHITPSSFVGDIGKNLINFNLLDIGAWEGCTGHCNRDFIIGKENLLTN